MPLRMVFLALLAVQVALSVAFAIGLAMPGRVPELVDLDQEQNLATWWSALLLAGLAAIAAGLGWADEERGRRVLWLVAALAFLYLSLDEVAGIHERLGEDIGTESLGGTRAWVLVLGPVLLIVAAALSRLTRALSPTQLRLAVVGVSLYVLALLVELVSIWSSDASDRVGVLVEENAEILGSNLVLVALLGALADRVAVSRLSRASSSSGGVDGST